VYCEGRGDGRLEKGSSGIIFHGLQISGIGLADLYVLTLAVSRNPESAGRTRRSNGIAVDTFHGLLDYAPGVIAPLSSSAQLAWRTRCLNLTPKTPLFY
jgi:hypothetical protein